MRYSTVGEVAEKLFLNLAAHARPGHEPESWEEVAAIGLDCLLLPEEAGGAGDAFDEACMVMEAFGRHGLCLPLLESMVANWLLAHSGHEIRSGAKAIALPIGGPTIRLRNDRTVEIAGSAAVVSSAMTKTLVVLAEDSSGALYAGVAAVPDHAMHGTSFAEEPVLLLPSGGITLLEPPRQIRRPVQMVRGLAPMLQAAAIGGAISRASELSLDYANQRQQFGRPIAAYQAIQHMAAQMAGEGALSAVGVELAARKACSDKALWYAAVAKATASKAAGTVAANAHQIHGAIGFTREYALHRFTLRLWDWRERYGHEDYWNAQLGRSVLASGPEQLWPSIYGGQAV